MVGSKQKDNRGDNIGLFTDYIIKNKDTKFWITLVLDIIIISALIFFAFKIKGEYQRGFEDCWKQCPAFHAFNYMPNGSNGTLNFNISIPTLPE